MEVSAFFHRLIIDEGRDRHFILRELLDRVAELKVAASCLESGKLS